MVIFHSYVNVYQRVHFCLTKWCFFGVEILPSSYNPNFHRILDSQISGSTRRLYLAQPIQVFLGIMNQQTIDIFLRISGFDGIYDGYPLAIQLWTIPCLIFPNFDHLLGLFSSHVWFGQQKPAMFAGPRNFRPRPIPSWEKSCLF